MSLTCDRTQQRHYGDDTGRRYFSVSQVCEVLQGTKPNYAPGSAERGTDLHHIFALTIAYEMGHIESPPSIPDEYVGYAQAVARWVAQSNPQPTLLEQTLAHPTLPYAGTPDFVGLLGESYGVVDLKTGQPEPWHKVQVQAYQKMGDKAAKLWLLYIRPDGTYKLVSVKQNPRDWAAFQSALNVLIWRENA